MTKRLEDMTDEELKALAKKDLSRLPKDKKRALMKQLKRFIQRQHSDIEAALKYLPPYERHIHKQQNQYLLQVTELAKAFSSVDRNVIDAALGQFSRLRTQWKALLAEVLSDDPMHRVIRDSINDLDQTEADMREYRRMIYGDGPVH
jgi:uncharacterized FlgJ-related protein